MLGGLLLLNQYCDTQNRLLWRCITRQKLRWYKISIELNKVTTNENNANHLKSIFKINKSKLNMDFKWLALFSFVVHLWPKLNVIKQS